MVIESLQQCLVAYAGLAEGARMGLIVLGLGTFLFYLMWALEILKLRKLKRFLREKNLLQDFADWEESKKI